MPQNLAQTTNSYEFSYISFMKTTTRIQLSLMMFLEYFVWGAWYVTMGTYLGSNLEFTGTQIGLAYGTLAIAAMISPFIVGLIADRFFAAERFLGVIHLLGAAILYAIVQVTDFGTFYGLLLAYSLCYMPTIALTNSLCFHQMEDPEKEFPSIRVLGTLGFIASVSLVSFMKVEDQALPFLVASGSSVLLGIYSFFLPHTPPKSKGKKLTTRDVLGLDALSLLKTQSFLIFFIASILICIPLQFYYTFGNLFLNNIGMEYAGSKMTLGQWAEVGFLLVMPFFFKRYGIKWMLIIGMAAWALRYVLFAFGDLGTNVWMLYAGIVLHGICYDFFFVTGQVYSDKVAPDSLRSSMQGLITFATYGVGLFIGSVVSGPIVDYYKISDDPAQYNWGEIWILPAAFSLAILLVFALLFRENKSQEVDDASSLSQLSPVEN